MPTTDNRDAEVAVEELLGEKKDALFETLTNNQAVVLDFFRNVIFFYGGLYGKRKEYGIKRVRNPEPNQLGYQIKQACRKYARVMVGFVWTDVGSEFEQMQVQVYGYIDKPPGQLNAGPDITYTSVIIPRKT